MSNDDGATGAIDLRTVPIHLGLGATATPVPEFAFTPDALAAYEERFAGDGDDGRLVGLFEQEEDWPTWECHPHGEEVVVLLSGRADLVQWIDGAERVVELRPCEAVVNPPGVWHTARVHEPGAAMFITPGRDTDNLSHDDFAARFH